ncbi:MAG: MBL fold metallo-hydrolase, partial [Candidatus Saccharimonadales bacterium]
MDLQFFGANCLVASGRGVRIVVDDNLANLGGKSVLKAGDVLLKTSPLLDMPEKSAPKLCIDSPGEYEVNDVSIYGIAARGHMDEDSRHSSTLYKLALNDLTILVTGHIYPELSEAQLEQIGEIDVMLVPVGGNGYTLDAVGTLKLIKAIEPKVVIPTHYADKELKYPVPQQELDVALKGLVMEPKEVFTKFKMKPSELSDVTQLV